ncbi:MAG: hypothetical protein AMXMBFR75_30330, partial [Candidatus Hinthialibacteria bacterium]
MQTFRLPVGAVEPGWGKGWQQIKKTT